MDVSTEVSAIPSSDRYRRGSCGKPVYSGGGRGPFSLGPRDSSAGLSLGRLLLKGLMCPAIVGLLLGRLAGAEADEAAAAHQAVDQLVKAIENQQELQVPRLRAEVGKVGPEAVKQVALRWSEVNDRVRGELAHAIGRIPGQEADEMLLNIALHSANRSVAANGLFYLGERAAAGNVPIRLKPEDWRLILDWVRRGEKHDSHIWAIVACGIRGVPQDELAETMLTGLRRRIATPSQEQGGLGWVSYMSPGVNWNSLFIRETARVEAAAMLPRLRRAEAESKDGTELMWLRIALGRCGAPEVKEEMLRLVEDTTLETSLRAEALRAYVGAAGLEAVPVLLKYKDDQTREPAWLARPPLGIVARDQLARLRAGATSVLE